jgi:pyridoxine 5-phosphate synthase
MMKVLEKHQVDRIELYTEDYARLYATDKQKPLLLYTSSAKATDLGIGINAGHDLS